MKILLQIGIFFAICLGGELISAWLPFPVPASVLGLILMFLLLFFGLLKPNHIQEKSDFLLQNMGFFFIPAGVGILEVFDSIKDVLLPVLFICLITTMLTFGAAALVVILVRRLQARRRGKEDE